MCVCSLSSCRCPHARTTLPTRPTKPKQTHRQGEEVEDFGAVPPRIGIAVLALALVVEAIHLRDLAGLVVAAQQRHARGVPRFEEEQEREGFQGVEAPVHEVAHEDVGGVGHLPTRGEQLE